MYSFRVNSVSIVRKYEKLAVCPDVTSIDDVLTLSSSYHCESGSGQHRCDRNFGGWSSSDKQVFNSDTEYFHEVANDGGGRCMAVWDVSHCAALTPNTNIRELTIVKLIEENCLIDISAQNQQSLKQGEPLAFGTHGTISFKSNCATDSRPYASVSDGLLFDDMLAKSQEYATLCPVYKNDEGHWKVRRSSVTIRRTGFDSWDSTISWAGSAEGRNLSTSMSTSTDGKQIWTSTEKIPPSSLAYSVSVCENEHFREVYISTRALKCEITSFEFGGYGFSSTNGNPVTLMSVSCVLPRDYSSCKAILYMDRSQKTVHFNCPGFIEVPSGVYTVLHLRSKNTVASNMPTRSVENAYGHDARLTTPEEHDSIWSSFASPFTSAISSLNNMIPIFLTLGAIVMFPGFFSNNYGFVLVVLVFLKFMPGSDAHLINDLTIGYDEELVAILCVGTSVHCALLTPILLLVLIWLTQSRIPPILHAILIFASLSDSPSANWFASLLWYICIRLDFVHHGVECLIRDTQENISRYFSPVYGSLSAVFSTRKLMQLLLRESKFENRSSNISFGNIEIFLYELAGTERTVMKLSLSGIKPSMVKKRFSNTGEGIKGMMNTLFYEQEFSKMLINTDNENRSVKDLLSEMDSSSIKTTWQRLPAICGRKPWDFSLFNNDPLVPRKLKSILRAISVEPG